MVLFIFAGAVITSALIISVYNYFTAPVLKQSLFSFGSPTLLSIMIPARNEGKNLRKCIRSILNQRFKNYELLILNDNSEDNTAEITGYYMRQDSRIKLIEGLPLPDNWTGKNWACHQLASVAKGDMLLFVDADVILSEDALNEALGVFREKKVKMLSVFPSQYVCSLGEALIVPLMNWILLSFLPLVQVHKSYNNSFVAANGQFIMFERSAYFRSGGHKIISSEIVEDMELARLFKSNMDKIITLLGGKSVYCRMYGDFKSSYNGFIKNFFPGFRVSPYIFFAIILMLSAAFIIPFVGIFYKETFLVLIILSLIERTVISLRSKQNMFINIFLHPAQIAFMLFIGLMSLIKYNRRDVYWKGRKILKTRE